MSLNTELRQEYAKYPQIIWHFDQELEAFENRNGYTYMYYTYMFDQLLGFDCIEKLCSILSIDEYRHIIDGFYSRLLGYDRLDDPNLEDLIIYLVEELSEMSVADIKDMVDDLNIFWDDFFNRHM